MVFNVLQHGAYISERLDLGLISTMFLDLLSVDLAKITVRSNEKARARREACEHRRISGRSVDRKYVCVRTLGAERTVLDFRKSAGCKTP